MTPRLPTPSPAAPRTAPSSGPAGDARARWPIPKHAPLLLAAIAITLHLALPPDADAQPPRFGLQADFGTAFGLGPTARSSIRLLDQRTEDDISVGTPSLEDAFRSPALRPSLVIQLSSIEVRYTLERSAWSHARRRCTTDDTATQLGSGAIDDSSIRWECGADQRVEHGDYRPPYTIHHVTTGNRFYAPEVFSFFPWAVLGGGLSLSRFDRDAQRRRLRAGLHATAGGGIDIPLDRSLTGVLDLRVMTTLIPATARFTDNARRATTLDRSVFSATFDVHHALHLSIGFRANLR